MTTSTAQAEPDVLSLFVYDEITVSESWGVSVVFALVILHKEKGEGTVVSVAEYRHLLGDKTSTDERITQRLEYLEAFCRGIIRLELHAYANKK